MTDMTRPPGDHTPAAPDARGESALGTGHRTTQGTDHDTARDADTGRGTTHGIETDRGAAHGTDADRAAAHGTDLPGTDRHDTDRLAAEAPRDDHRTTPDKAGPAKNRAHLLAHDDLDKLGAQLHHAVAGFVDGPRAAVEEADHVLEEIAARFTEAVTQRRRTLRHSWQSVEGGEGRDARSVSSADTEQLRLALKDYRELAERLLHV
ncbi:hypothetical protein [Streptomyces sp. NPDC007929]|uniref:hypothetical protein n=1 Tax=unclassified Streptomyces TaxID=2593676 RepID=UPI0036E593D2